MRLRAKTDPVTIAQAREQRAQIQVHCLHCGKMTVIDPDRSHDHETVPELPTRYRFRCKRRGFSKLHTQPDYPGFRLSNTSWCELTKK